MLKIWDKFFNISEVSEFWLAIFQFIGNLSSIFLIEPQKSPKLIN